MPKTKKGTRIYNSMKRTYGKERAARVFYASLNAGKIKGVEKRKSSRLKRK
jgi:hypothetical protein